MGTSDLSSWTEAVGKLGPYCSQSASEVGGGVGGLSPSTVGSAFTLVTVRVELNSRTPSWWLQVWEGTHISGVRCAVSVVVTEG